MPRRRIRATLEGAKEVSSVPVEAVTKQERATSGTPASSAVGIEREELRAAAERQVARMRRLKLNAAAWGLGAIVFTTLWVLSQWQANGALESFGHEGEHGQWNPTLWALAVGIWGLVVGIMALRVHFERPANLAEVDRAVERLGQTTAGGVTAAELRRFARARLEELGRLRFHVAAWVLGMVVLTPLWALVEWQDNGGFEHWSSNSRPGDWEPWILYIGGIWAFVIAMLALRTYLERPTREEEIDRELERMTRAG
jgi:hypothetical protein